MKLNLRVPTPWTDYHHLDIDESRSLFTVELDRSGTRLLRASIHHDACPRCQEPPDS